MSHALVYGGAGALGTSIVRYFRARQWEVTSVDLHVNPEASRNVLVVLDQGEKDLEGEAGCVVRELETFITPNQLDAIFCVAGGWVGGNAASNTLFHTAALTLRQSVFSSLIAAHLATRFLKRGGLLTLTGAKAARLGTPTMIGYGLAKAAVHQLVQSLAMEGSGLPVNARVNAILPVTLDTAANRDAMPSADRSRWTPPETIALKLFEWASDPSTVCNGGLVDVVTQSNGVTTFTPSS